MGSSSKLRTVHSKTIRSEDELVAAIERLNSAVTGPFYTKEARSIACGPSPPLSHVPDDHDPEPPFHDFQFSEVGYQAEALSHGGFPHLDPESICSQQHRSDELQVSFRRFFEEHSAQARRWWISPYNPERGTLEEMVTGIDWLGADVYNIEKDVDRTFPSSSFFAAIKGVARIKRIAAAYAVRNPSVGYCQGMNFLLGYLLMALEVFFPTRRSEEVDSQVFYLIARIVESPDFNSRYYDKEDYMCRLKGDFVVLEKLLQDCLPDVAHHIRRFSETTPIIMYVASKWFIAVFIGCLQPDTLVQVWDMYLQDGILAVFWVSLLIFHQCKAEILQASDLEIIDAISKGAKQLPSCALQGLLLQSMRQVVTRDRIQELRRDDAGIDALPWNPKSRSCELLAGDGCVMM